MMDPLNYVHAFHAAKEVHRDYLRRQDEEEPVETGQRLGVARRALGGIATWLKSVRSAPLFRSHGEQLQQRRA